MSYCTGKNIEIARGNAMKELILEKRSVAKALNLISARIDKNEPIVYNKGNVL